RRDQLIFLLLRDAADAARVAARRDRDRALPAPQKDVARRRTGVVERAVGVMRQHAILWLGLQPLAHGSLEFSTVERAGEPPGGIVGLDSGGVEGAAPARDGAVAKEGQREAGLGLGVGGQMRARIANWQQRGQRPAATHGLLRALRVQPD